MDSDWKILRLDVEFGYLAANTSAPRQRHPQLVVNTADVTVLRTIREELRYCKGFTFSVAFVSPRAIALLKQEFVEFAGDGRIITSDYLGFNSPEAFAELHNLVKLGIDVRIHDSDAFHPKGYVFSSRDGVTAMVGSANLTENALAKNHEWNLKVSAATHSDLADQIESLISRELEQSRPLTKEWIADYAKTYVPPTRRVRPRPAEPQPLIGSSTVLANEMQTEALKRIAQVREAGHQRAIVISATGTGKTILSALDVRAFNASRLLFVVHREQILDRTIEEYRRVLGGPATEYGKLTGQVKQADRRHVFATVQTLSQSYVLNAFDSDTFDYVVVDEAHRAAADSYQRVLEHLCPRFLLGMTATPERTDGVNVFEIFAYNVPYEIRLNHALEEGMLTPFHYYGVAEVVYDNGETITGDSDLSVLVSPERVDHLIGALETYGQAGVDPRGLIFCSRKKEAVALSAALNQRTLRGRPLRTVALTGGDPVTTREATVAQLEAGELDYVLTVDIFNEGVDIPSVNQVVMLRQTQSAIVFVQQLGRGLRKAADKEYLVVIDFIGAYANNFLIPIALFGDDSLNKESLRKNMIAAEEKGVLPGLSSVRFDRVSQERVLQAIAQTKLDNVVRLKAAIEAMRDRVGGAPRLWDFVRFESADPVLLATSREHFPALLHATISEEPGLSNDESGALGLLSHEVMTAKRQHEFVLLKALLARGRLAIDEVAQLFAERGLPDSAAHVRSAIDTLTLEHHSEADCNRYRRGIAARGPHGAVELTAEVLASYTAGGPFAAAVEDLLETGWHLATERYDASAPFSVGRQYSRKEVARALGWPRKWSSTIYGYRVDREAGVCPLFVTLHKSADVVASTAYEDELIDRTTMRWFTRSRRTLKSDEVRAIVDNDVAIYVFVKKDDAEGTDFYYLGQATSTGPEQTTMPGADGTPLGVVRMLLRFDEPIDIALYDYFHPTVTS